MIRLFIILVFSSVLLFSKTSIDTNIKNTNTKLNSFTKNYSKINKKMSQTAKAILKQKRDIDKQ